MKKNNQQPNNWKKVSLGDADYFKILSSGINKFDNTKKYLSTSSVQEDKIINIESEITFDDRPSRANMQPILNSVWFAKMKDTLKILEKTIDNLAYKRAMEKINHKKSIKTWKRLEKKIAEFTKIERAKIIAHIVGEGK